MTANGRSAPNASTNATAARFGKPNQWMKRKTSPEAGVSSGIEDRSAPCE